ncbi:hypothetical protein PCI56_16520 [Plesiomonas shigelloides subsp. oncorhynchi]|nr:hypothetical protein [Plesiomonas shigelloides]
MSFATGGHMLNLDWLMDSVAQIYPLALDRAQARLQDREFLMCASRYDDFQPVYMSASADNWHDAMKASSAIPGLYRNGVDVGAYAIGMVVSARLFRLKKLIGVAPI